MLREFAAGFGYLGRGYAMWRRRPRLMASGLLPAVISFVLLALALTALGFSLPRLVDWSTPFADGWQAGWRTALRLALGVVMFSGAAALAVVTFTALTLTIGDPFYERIHAQAEADLGPPLPAGGAGFWSGIVDGARLVVRGIGVAVVVALIGLLPGVGTPLAAVLGVVLTGRLLARELTARAFDAHGIDSSSRAALLRTWRWRVLGFGVATQLCFLVPLGAVITMPAAVVGATCLAREVMRPVPA